jgi:hypothetical protein
LLGQQKMKKKYTVKFYCVDYRECEIVVEADNANEAYNLADEKNENGEGEYNLVHFKTWKKPTVKKL